MTDKYNHHRLQRLAEIMLLNGLPGPSQENYPHFTAEAITNRVLENIPELIDTVDDILACLYQQYYACQGDASQSPLLMTEHQVNLSYLTGVQMKPSKLRVNRVLALLNGFIAPLIGTHTEEKYPLIITNPADDKLVVAVSTKTLGHFFEALRATSPKQFSCKPLITAFLTSKQMIYYRVALQKLLENALDERPFSTATMGRRPCTEDKTFFIPEGTMETWQMFQLLLCFDYSTILGPQLYYAEPSGFDGLILKAFQPNITRNPITTEIYLSDADLQHKYS